MACRLVAIMPRISDGDGGGGVMDFSNYDSRRYPIVPVAEGYADWAPTYEATVLDLMDLRVAESLTTVRWPDFAEALDLACGTGRLGQWLAANGVAAVDGVDITPAMLERARSRGVYRTLLQGDVTSTGLPEQGYGLVCQSLADEHLADLHPLYMEAFRLARPGGVFVLLGYHPWFLMTGMAAHFDRAPGQPVAIQSYVHLFSDHVAAAHAAGWRLQELCEALIDDAWIEAKPKWKIHRNRPISFGVVWRR
jgi:SAM-dependent methyltransferase